MAVEDQVLSGTVPASGTVDLVLRSWAGQTWTIQQVSPDAPNVGGAASGGVYKNDNLIAPFVPQGDAVAGEPYPKIRGSDRLQIRWTGATPGAQVSALVIYDDGT